jgi:hypothetical protein
MRFTSLVEKVGFMILQQLPQLLQTVSCQTSSLLAKAI